jgi:rhamnosyltransferase
MIDSSPPTVCVLLATYNGARFLDEQLASLRGQTDVEVLIVASDDRSRDATPELLERYASKGGMHILPPPTQSYGSANRNFLRLVADCPRLDQDYYAFCDQDDIWFAHKLSHSIQMLAATHSDIYSSDVEAFWLDGRAAVIRKSQPQVRFDHMLEAAGPGCTYVLRRDVFLKLREWVTANYAALQSVRVHDWLIYAWARICGMRWFIDPTVTMRYRQHANNEAGANVGWRHAKRRMADLLDGSFRRDAIKIAEVLQDDSPFTRRLRRLRTRDRLRLALGAGQVRRKSADRWIIRLFFLLSR